MQAKIFFRYIYNGVFCVSSLKYDLINYTQIATNLCNTSSKHNIIDIEGVSVKILISKYAHQFEFFFFSQEFLCQQYGIFFIFCFCFCIDKSKIIQDESIKYIKNDYVYKMGRIKIRKKFSIIFLSTMHIL